MKENMVKPARNHIIRAALAALLALSLVGCGSAAGKTADSSESAAPARTDGARILIAYFTVAENSEVDAISSASVPPGRKDERGYVRILAEDIQAAVGGDLFPILTSTRYPGDITAVIDQAALEQDEDARPELTSRIENLDDYDTIFIGYPNWWADLPMVLYSFFEETDLAGKTIIPFCSHNGSGFSGTIDTIRELEPDAVVLDDGFTINQRGVPEAAQDVAEWAESLAPTLRNVPEQPKETQTTAAGDSAEND